MLTDAGEEDEKEREGGTGGWRDEGEREEGGEEALRLPYLQKVLDLGPQEGGVDSASGGRRTEWRLDEPGPLPRATK